MHLKWGLLPYNSFLILPLFSPFSFLLLLLPSGYMGLNLKCLAPLASITDLNSTQKLLNSHNQIFNYLRLWIRYEHRLSVTVTKFIWKMVKANLRNVEFLFGTHILGQLMFFFSILLQDDNKTNFCVRDLKCLSFVRKGSHVSPGYRPRFFCLDSFFQRAIHHGLLTEGGKKYSSDFSP